MVKTYPRTTRLNNPDTWFDQDLIQDKMRIPALERPDLAPALQIYARGEGPGNPDIVTARTEAYIIGWREKLPTASNNLHHAMAVAPRLCRTSARARFLIGQFPMRRGRG